MTQANSFLHFQYLPDFQVLFCDADCCKYCLIPGESLERHVLREHDIRGKQKKAFMTWVRTLDLIEPGKLRIPAHGSLPVPQLLMHPGFACTVGGYESCSTLTHSQKKIKMHLSKVHDWTKKHSTAPWRELWMQYFFHASSPTGCHYFEVKREGQDIAESRSSSSMHQLILPLDKSRQARDLEVRQEEEMTKFLQEFDGIDEAIRGEVHRIEETAWLQKTK